MSSSPPTSHTIRLGDFALDLESGGKLRQVWFRDHEPLLVESEHQLDLGGGQSFRVAGWDECFPSIEPSGDTGSMGDLVRSAPVIIRGPNNAIQAWRNVDFEATRGFTAAAADQLVVSFHAINRGLGPMPFLWASHALFAADSAVALRLPDGRTMPDLGRDGSTSKSFVEAGTDPAMLIRRFDRIILRTDQPYWGLWLNRGGWPAGRPAGLCCVGIEATNAPSDSPAGAILKPGESFFGTVTLTVSANT